MSCPICDSMYVTETDCYVTNDIPTETQVMYITYECDKCNSRWDEVWIFDGIEHLEEADKRESE